MWKQVRVFDGRWCWSDGKTTNVRQNINIVCATNPSPPFSSLPIINPPHFRQYVWNKEDESPPSLSEGGVEIQRDPKRNKIQTGILILSKRPEPPLHPLPTCHDSRTHTGF